MPRSTGGTSSSSPQVGWLASACNATSPDVLLVTRAGGARWAPQPLPVPASAFRQVGCEVYSPPQFFGQTGFVVIGEGPDAPHFLVSRDLRKTWQLQPSGAGWYPRITFFGPRDGVLVSAGAQGVIGLIFDTTADGGRTWTAIRQGRSFGSATEFDFLSPRTGFAWVPAGDTPPDRPPSPRPPTPGSPGRPSSQSWPAADRPGAAADRELSGPGSRAYSRPVGTAREFPTHR
jgi:hypothetical protein